ncbi:MULTISPECIES: hypothetical protein [Paenibacillus]|uniref:Uncharacterized protein n=1 Tax=Paenibacillus agri TaxID=2744309 RepID=A0A850EUL1_9BACL|nr:hypothetical protein [Paenibacillus agri]NUU64276.1 hypothetical protein [Paenibacillus agri]
MNMTVHSLMAFNHQYFRPQPVANSKQKRADEKMVVFRDVLKEKMRSGSGLKK